MSFDMKNLFLRAANTCTGSKQWYVCTAGNFRGCCSSDPCTSGLCPDYDEGDASSTSVPGATSVAGLTAVTARIGNPLLISATTSSSTSTTTTTTTTTTTDPATISSTGSETLTTTATSTTSTTSEATRVTALSSVLGVSHVSTAAPSSESSASGAASNRGALIGGVVGGVAALIICAILLFCCCRRRRRQGTHEKRPSIIPWYPQGAARSLYGRNRSSEAKAISPSNSEGYTASDSLTTFIPSNTSTTISTTTSSSTETEHGRTSTTALTMGSCVSRPGPCPSSSSTNLISHPLRLKASSSIPPVPPIPPFSNELAAPVPIPLPQRQDFIPELPDTNFYRLRCELASHLQSELINVPIDRRWLQNQNQNQNSRGMPRAWESTSSIPLAYTRGGTSQSPGQSGSKNENGSPVRQPAGPVITADGVVLAANLDRYSSGMEIGRPLDRGRTVGRDRDDHVMSFMHYGNGGRAERAERGGGLGDGCRIEMQDTAYGRGRVNNASREEQRTQAATAILEDDLRVLDCDGDVHGDVLPAYDGKDGSSELDIKPLAGRMEMSVRT